MKVGFDVVYGHNEIEIPIPERAKHLFSDGSTNFFSTSCTIYNDMPKTLTEERHFDRHVIPLCCVQGGYVDRANGTVANIVNAKTVITKAVDTYKPPMEYAALPVDQRESYYTVKTGDFIVFGEVDDVVETAADFAQLQQKYKENGIKIQNVTANIFGMAVDNVTMTSA